MKKAVRIATLALARAGGRFIVPSGDEVRAILQNNPAPQPVTLPAKSYVGQDAPLQSVGSCYAFAGRHLGDEAKYLVEAGLLK